MKKKDKIYLIVIFLVLLLLVFGFYKCGRNRIHYAKNTSTEVFEPQLSRLYFPVYLSINDLQKLANQKLKTVLIDKVQVMANQKDSLDLKAIRTGDLQFYMKDEKLHAYMPLKVEITIIKKMGKGSVSFFRKNPIQFEIGVHAVASFDLNSDMKIDAATTITQIEWKQDPTVKIAGIDFNVKELVEKNLDERLPELTEQLNNVIKEKINLRKTVDRIWTKLQHGKPVDKKEQTFFVKIQPQNLSVYVDKSKNDTLCLNLVVESKLYLRHASDTSSIKHIPLPKQVKVLQEYNNEKNSNVHLHALIPIDALNEALNKKLKNKELSAKGLKVKIKTIELTTGKDCIVGQIDVAGDLNGTIGIKGLPVFSKEKKLLTIEKIDIESKLNDDLMNTVADMFVAEIIQLLNIHSTINTDEYFGKVPDLARDEIEKSKLAEKADVILNKLIIKDIKLKLTKDNIQLLVEVNPDFEIAVKKEGLKIKK